MAVIDPGRTWESLQKRLAETTSIQGEDSYHSGRVRVTKLTRDELPQEYVDLVHG